MIALALLVVLVLFACGAALVTHQQRRTGDASGHREDAERSSRHAL